MIVLSVVGLELIVYIGYGRVIDKHIIGQLSYILLLLDNPTDA